MSFFDGIKEKIKAIKDKNAAKKEAKKQANEQTKAEQAEPASKVGVTTNSDIFPIKKMDVKPPEPQGERIIKESELMFGIYGLTGAGIVLMGIFAYLQAGSTAVIVVNAIHAILMFLIVSEYRKPTYASV